MVATIPQEWSVVVPRRRPETTENPGVLARILYRLRAERGWTQVQVAQRAGWKGNSYYSDLEGGVIKMPGEEKVALLEHAFGTEPGWIERQLPRRARSMREERVTYDVAGGDMEIEFLSSEIRVRRPTPSVRRIVEHVRALSERAQRNLERTALDLREQEDGVAVEADPEAARLIRELRPGGLPDDLLSLAIAMHEALRGRPPEEVRATIDAGLAFAERSGAAEPTDSE